MSKREPDVLLDDILTCIKKIQNYLVNMSKKDVFSDEKTQDAIVRNLEIIGEASRQLSAKFIKAHSGVPWLKMIGMRNRIAHDYFGVDMEVVWEVISKELAPLGKLIEVILNEIDKQNGS